MINSDKVVRFISIGLIGLMLSALCIISITWFMNCGYLGGRNEKSSKTEKENDEFCHTLKETAKYIFSSMLLLCVLSMVSFMKRRGTTLRITNPCHILGSRFISFVSTATDCIRKGKKKLTMSETHSEQRKLGKVVESSANKKARREVSKKYGKFTEDCIPDGVFPIGDDVFVFASIYYDSVSVHIRRFKKYGKTYYPTPEGITLDPQWIEYIMRKKKVPESLEELPSGLFPPERHIQITSENFTNFTFKRIKYGPNKEPTFKEISISREQWAEMIEKYGAIENAVIDNVFLCMDFLTAYKTFCEGPIENALPFSLDVSLGQRYLTQILKKSICSLLNEKGLNQPQKLAEELWGNREETFNSHVLSLEANEIADYFYNNLFEN
ncbi:hypothetical protein TNCT_328941, partial [Trichonephila clavata]